MEVNVVEIKLENLTEQVEIKNVTEPTNNVDIVVSVKKESDGESVGKEDPFASLNSNNFTSEKYKVEIRNLPKHYGIAISCIILELLLD